MIKIKLLRIYKEINISRYSTHIYLFFTILSLLTKEEEKNIYKSPLKKFQSIQDFHDIYFPFLDNLIHLLR